MTKLKIEAGGLTDVGRKRDHNEDSILVSKELGLFAVADGMGGHAAGEVASKTAISKLQSFVRRMEEDHLFAKEQTVQEGLSPGQNILYLGITHANRELCSMAEENTAYFGMGTTLAAMYINTEQLHIAHVGDSRVYRFRENQLEILTQDHSWVNEQLQKNILTEEEARTHRWRNVITRALGNRNDVEIDLKTVEVRKGDYYLICSDGLTSMVDDTSISQIIEQLSDDLDKTCSGLIEMANEAGGHDNVSVVLVRIDSDPSITADGITPLFIQLPDDLTTQSIENPQNTTTQPLGPALEPTPTEPDSRY